MKIKKGAEPIASDNEYYDLFVGGYLKPERFLENEEDIKKVNDATGVISEYLSLLESEGLLEEM